MASAEGEQTMLCAVELAIAPIAGASLCMDYGNDINSILVMPEGNLKRELLHAARPAPSVDPNKPFGIGLNVRKRDVHGDAEVASGGGTAFCIPIR